MRLPIRAVFAVVLWCAALSPPLLWAVSWSSPVAAVRLAAGAVVALRWALLVAGGALLAALLVYPPFLPGLRLGLARLRARLGTDLGPLREAQARLQHLETAADHFNAGRVLLQQGDAARASSHLQRAVELDPEHVGSRYHLGRARAAAGDPAGAIEQLARAVEADPEHAFGAAMLELGALLERAGADEKAVDVLREHERRFGPNRRAQLHRARALLRRGDRDAAVTDLREAAKAPAEGRRMTAEDALVRAKAKLLLWRGAGR